MFHSIIEDLNKELPDSIALFKYYLDRHIEVDGDHHSHLALQMTANLCGNDESKWHEVLEISKQCLHFRKELWTGILQELQEKSLLSS
jgi:hypothetical protein